MAKCRSATSLLALALLSGLVGTNVEAQGSMWQIPAAPVSQGAPPPPAPLVHLPPPPPKVVPRPQVPKVPPPPPPKIPQYPQYPQMPQVPPPLPPKAPQYPQYPQYPQVPKVLPPPPPPKVVPRPQVPQVLPPPPPPKVVPRPQVPQVLPPPPPPPKIVPRPQVPQVLPPPPPPPKVVPHPQVPQVLPPSPQFPQYPQVPNVPPPPPPKIPQYPQYPQMPQVKPAPPQVLPPPFPPRFPQYPETPQFSGYPRAFSNSKPPQEPEAPQPQQPQQSHQPTSPQEPSIYQPSAPKQPFLQSCEVAQNVRVPCGGVDISAAACEAISCCFDGRQCYFGKAVTVQCTKDAQFIVVVARDATLPNIDLESISLLGGGQGCTHVDSNSDFAIYQFPVTGCGSVVMEQPGVIIYENRMTSSYEVGVGLRGIITRDSFYELIFQCRYIGTSVETVVAEVLPLQDPPLPVAALGPIRVHLRLANGQCQSKGCNELDVAYSSFYTEADYPVTKVLREPVYVEVQLIEKTDPNLVLTLGRCWTTTSSNPHSLPQWDILIDGCPYRDDRYLSSLVPVGPSSGLDFPSHYRRFIFKMFTFVDPSSLVPLKEQIYIHCSTAVCSAAPGRTCEPSCFRKKRDVQAVDQRSAEPKVVTSVGPVIMGAPEQ